MTSLQASVMNEPLPPDKDGDFTVPTINSTGILKILGTFDITLGGLTVTLPGFSGYIFDNDEIKTYAVTFDEVKEFSPTYINTNNSTYVLIDRHGVLSQQDIAPTDIEKQHKIYLCDIQHPNGIIIGVIPGYDFIIQDSNTLGSAIRFLDPMVRGCKIIDNGANLHINRIAGSILLKDSQDATRANVMQISAANAFSFQYILENSTKYLTTDTIDPDNYDNGGILSSVPAGRFTIQRIGITYKQEYLIQYGNQTYSTLEDSYKALSNIDIVFPTEQTLKTGAILAYIIIKQNATSLQNIDEASINNTNNFCEVGTGIGGSVGALLAANNLSDVKDVATSRINLGAGAANGLATLDSGGILTASQRPFGVQTYGAAYEFSVNNRLMYKIMDVLMNSATVGNATNIRVQFYATITDVTFTYVLKNETTTIILSTNSINSTGFQNILASKPLGDAMISFNVYKNADGGTNPIITGLIITYE